MTALRSLTPVLTAGWAATAAIGASTWVRRYVTRPLDPPADAHASPLGTSTSRGPTSGISTPGIATPQPSTSRAPTPGTSTPGISTWRSSTPDIPIPRLIASEFVTAVTALGRAVRRLAPGARTPAARASGTESDDQRADRRAGWATLWGAGLLVVAPVLAAVPVVWAVAGPVLAARRQHARLDAWLHDQLPDVVDLLALTAAAGLPVGAALVAIGDRPGGPLGAALARAAAHVRRGGSTAGALAVLGDVGAPARPLVDALVQHDRYGTPLLPALERVAIEARARRRRRAEEAARRLPVTLLFPLVFTTFPAFVLLTVVPLLAGSLGSLSLSPT